MTRKKCIFLIVCSLFVGFLGATLDAFYAVAEDMAQEGVASPLYDFLKPFWTTIIRPVPYYLFDLLPDNEFKYVYFSAIGISFWLAIGLTISLSLLFVWSNLRKLPK
jgi:hypothetical protein